MVKMNLNRLPLLTKAPAEGLLSALDHAPLIRETLREYLEFDVETLGIGITDTVKEDFVQRFDQINQAEEEIMKVQAINMKVLENLLDNGMDSDPRDKKCDLSEETAKKFHLIRFEDLKMNYDDLLFHKAVDDNHLNCPLRELNESGPHNSQKTTSKQLLETSNKSVPMKVSRTREKFKSYETIEEECIPRHCLGFYDLGVSPLHNKWDAVGSEEDPITIIPNAVEFDNQKVGHTYLKKVRLNNTSNRMLKFEIRMASKGSRNFDVVFSKAMHRHFSLAPGMSMHFFVKFKCSDLDDHETDVFVDLIDGRAFMLPVTTRRLIPTLISEKFIFPSKPAMPEFKKSSAITVDCGIRFLGTETKVTARLFNVGSDAKYYITTEEDWELGKIPDVQANNTLSFSYFTVEPVLFCLGAGNKVNLNFTFTPTCERLFTEKLMILCDNYAIRSIDVIGEAVLFDPTHFCINAHSKTFDVDEDDLYDAIQSVDFGIVKKNSSSTKEIRFSSGCPVEVDFHWELRQLPNWPEGYDIKAHQLSFSPNVGTLCAFSTEEMEITCSTADMANGIHKSFLCFVAKDIPRKCLIKDDIPGQRLQTDDYVTIDLMYVELRVTVAELHIELDPRMIIFRNRRFRTENYEIHVHNTSHWFVKVEWVLPEPLTVEFTVTPPSAQLLPCQGLTFDLQLTGMRMGKFDELLKLECPDDGVCFNLRARGEVISPDPPETVFLCHDIGPQQSGADVSFEIPLNFDETAEDYPLLSTEVDGKLDFEGKKGDDIKYKMLGTGTSFVPLIPRQFPYSTPALEKSEGSDLRLTTVQMEAAQMEFYVDTIALVQDVDVVLDRSEVDLGPDFYQRVPIKTKVTLVNRNQISVNFEWRPPVGPEARHFVVEYEPKEGRLDRLGRQSVEITLTADRPGKMDELILSCEMGRESKTLQFVCKGVCRDVVVQISYPYKEDFVRITWPRVPTTLLNVSEDLDMKDERCCICFISKFGEVDGYQSTALLRSGDPGNIRRRISSLFRTAKEEAQLCIRHHFPSNEGHVKKNINHGEKFRANTKFGENLGYTFISGYLSNVCL